MKNRVIFITLPNLTQKITLRREVILTHQATLIYNPTADKGTAGKILPAVQALLGKHGFEYDLEITQGPGHAQALARQAAEGGKDAVIAAGGDGTINEVINGLMLAETQGRPLPVFGVLPIGTGNDFAYGVRIPVELEKAIEVLKSGHIRVIDVGRVSGGDFPAGRYFGNGVGLGFDTVVGLEAGKIKWLHGAASYLAGLVSTIFLYSKAPIYEVVLDEGKAFRQPFLMVSIMNGIRMGGSFHMAPDGHPGDGVFNLCLAGQVPQIKILPLALKFIKGSQKGHPAVNMTQARRVSIRAIEGSIPAHADGELICAAGKELQVEILPGALRIFSLNHEH